MKRQHKKVFLVALCLLMTLLLPGCGAKVSTVLTINSNDGFSGQRVITCVTAKSDVEENFKGGVKKIDAIFADSCPAELSYAKTEDADNYIYTLKLSFSSLDDYKQKVQQIVGKEVNVNFSTPNTVFANGVALSEDFNSTDLLGWFRKVAEEEELIDDANNLWEISDTNVILNGKEYSSGGNIDVNDVIYNPLDRIVINTTVNSNGSFKRIIKYFIPSSTYDEKANAIRSFMEDIVPTGAKGTWTPDTYGQTFTLMFNAKDANELMKKTGEALYSKNCSLRQKTAKGNNPFSQYIRYTENLEFSAFASDSEGRVNVEYNFKTPGSDKIVEVQQDDNTYNPDTDNYTNSFCTNVLTLKLLTEKFFTVDSVNVKTSVKSETQINKDIVFTYAANIPSEAASKAGKYFESLKIPILKVNTFKNNSGHQICEIKISGSIQEVNSALISLFGQGNSIQYITQKKSMISKQGFFDEKLNMAQFLSQIGYSKNINYTIEANKGEKIKELSILNSQSSNSYQDVGNTYTSSIPPNAAINYSGNKITIFGLLFLILVILLIAFALIFFIKRLAKNDGLQDKNLKTLVAFYWRKMEDYITGVSVADKARIPIFKYFYGSKWPIILVILTILQIPSLIGRLIGLGSIFSILTLLAAFIWFLAERLNTSAKQEAIIDAFIESDLSGFKERALLKLGLVDEQVSLIDPIKITGPDYDFSKPDEDKSILAQIFDFIVGLIRYKPRLIFKYGSDDKVRYSLIHAQIFLFNETQIYVYEIQYDLCTGEIFEESTTEYFYQNVDCVVAGEKTENIISRKEIIKKKFEFFKVIVSSGEYNHAVVDTEQSILNNQIMAMRNLIREKKEMFKQSKNKKMI